MTDLWNVTEKGTMTDLGNVTEMWTITDLGNVTEKGDDDRPCECYRERDSYKSRRTMP